MADGRVLSIGFCQASLLLFAACSTSTVVTNGYDPELARGALIVALAAWKAGQTDQLPELDPPIRFVDDDQRTGWQLVDFDLDSTSPLRPHQNVKVTLILRDQNGLVLDKIAVYQVGLAPRVTVLRSDH